MGKTEEEIQRGLAAFFDESDIEWKPSRFGEKDGKGWAQMLAYITNRAIQQRLDDVVGVGHWRNEYVRWGTDGVLCGISIFIEREGGFADWVTKWDGADESDIESTKGGLSNSMKRAGVQWGIGRYLYELGVTFCTATITARDGNKFKGFVKDSDYPKMDKRWLPAAQPPPPKSSAPATAQQDQRIKNSDGKPPDWLDWKLPSKDFGGETWRQACAGELGGRHHHWLGWMALEPRLRPRDENDKSPMVQVERARLCLYAIANKKWPTGPWSFNPADFPFAYHAKPADTPDPTASST